MNTTTPLWNTALYEQKHAFVWQYGEDLIQILAPQSGEYILDLGCGTGQLTAQIAATGAEVVGIDHSVEMIEKATANYPHLTFRAADAKDLQFDRPFDAVFSNAVLHWIKEPDAVIRSIEAGLKSGGRFVAEFGGKGNVQAIVTALNQALTELGYRSSEAFNPWYFPSISEYTTRLEQQGFEVLSASLFDRPTPLDPGKAGLANWLAMFTKGFLAQLSAQQYQQLIQSVEAKLRPTLYQNGRWIIDYRRIRIVARRL